MDCLQDSEEESVRDTLTPELDTMVVCQYIDIIPDEISPNSKHT